MDAKQTYEALMQSFARTIRLGVNMTDTIVVNTNPCDYEQAYSSLRKLMLDLAVRLEG